MDIQWYPGHMTKARRSMEKDVRLVDLIIELRDARAPYSTENPDLARLAKGKKRLILRIGLSKKVQEAEIKDRGNLTEKKKRRAYLNG